MESTARNFSKSNVLLTVLLSALFFVFPFWSGMFFTTATAASGIYVGVLLFAIAVWSVIRKTEVKGFTWLDALAGMYTLIVLLSVFTYAHLEFTLAGIAEQFGYLFFYLLIRFLLSKGLGLKPFFYMIALSGSMFSIYGLLVVSGVVDAPGAISRGADVRIASVFEYPNTYASYLAVALLFGLALQAQMQNRLAKSFWIFANALSFAGLILSYSRGGWLIFLVAYVAMVFLAPRGQRAGLNVQGAFVLVVAAASLSFFNQAMLTTSLSQGLIGFGIAIVLALLFGFLLKPVEAKVNSISWKMTIVIPVLIVLFAGGGFAAAKFGLLPENLAERIASINLQSFSVQQRFVFYQDGLSALQDHPLIGAGDRTWEATFYKYQSYPYYTTAPHSLLIDQVMNAGLIGTLLFLAIVVLAVAAFWKLRKGAEAGAGQSLFYAAALAGFLELVFHAMIDVDFNYAVIGYLFWLLVAVAASHRPWSLQSVNAMNEWKWNPRNRWFWWTGLAFSLAVMLFSSSYVYAQRQLDTAKNNLGTPSIALQHLDKARAVAPYIPDVHWVASQMEERYYDRSQDPVIVESMAQKFAKTAEVSPNNSILLVRSGQQLYKYKKYLDGAALVQRAWENAPYRSEIADQHMVFSMQIGEALLQNDKSQAKGYFESTVRTYQDVLQRIEGFKDLPPVLHLERPYEVTPTMRENASRAAFYLNDLALAQQIATDGLQTPNANLAKLQAVLAAVQQKQGKLDPNLFLTVQKDQSALALFQGLISYQP